MIGAFGLVACNMTLYSLGDLRKLVTQVFVNSKTSKKNSKFVAEALVKAESDGLVSHGLARVSSYAAQSISGKVNGYAEPSLKQLKSGACQVDANKGFAYSAIDLGLRWSLKKVATSGVIGLGISNSHHAGVLGHHVERVANAGFIGLGFSNSPSALGPWGGNKALYGTNPIAFSCPRSGQKPLIVDLSMSKVARGKIMIAAKNGDKIPQDWAVDKDGKQTTDAEAALAGTMLPLGGAKGAALTLIIEMLAATLTGSNYGFEATSFFSEKGAPPSIGQFFFIVDPNIFGNGEFELRVETLLQAILDQSGTRLPGQRRFKIRDRSEKIGLEVSDEMILEFRNRAKNFQT